MKSTWHDSEPRWLYRELADEDDMEELKMDFECYAYFIKNKMKMELIQMRDYITHLYCIGFDGNKILLDDWQELPPKVLAVIVNAMCGVLGNRAKRYFGRRPFFAIAFEK